MPIRTTLANLIGDLQTYLVLHSPLTKKAVESVAGLPPEIFRIRMKEKLEKFSDKDLESAFCKLNTPETKIQREMVVHLAGLGILEEIKELLGDEIFLRKRNAG